MTINNAGLTHICFKLFRSWVLHRKALISMQNVHSVAHKNLFIPHVFTDCQSEHLTIETILQIQWIIFLNSEFTNFTKKW